MATTEITKNPSRKKSRSRLNADSRKEKPIVESTPPIVDVPSNREDEVKTLVKETKDKVEKYLTTNFNGVDKKTISLVTRECAECLVYKRSVQQNDAWDKDIIEEVILHCFPAYNAKEETKLAQSEPAQEQEEEELEPEEFESEEEPDHQEEEAIVAKKTAKKVKAAKQKNPKVKAGSKKIANKPPKKEKVKKAPKAKAPAKKVLPKGAIGVKGEAKLFEELKTQTGVKQFEAACAILKKQKKIWMQKQDIPMVAEHLYKVHVGKEEMKPKLQGSGEKDYAKRRLVKTLTLVQQLIA